MHKHHEHYGPDQCWPDHGTTEQCRPEHGWPGHCGPDQCCTGHGWPDHDCAEQCRPGQPFAVPPPIPPVRYEPGLNVQDQLVNMAQRVNVSIHRWNEIQANCYEALNRVVGAAVDTSVYYNECDVRHQTGFDSASGCTYNIVQIKHRDRAGNHIAVSLFPAYQNVTNSGAVENMETASFVQSAQCIISAVPFNAARWEGPMLYKCMPGASTENDDTFVAGFTHHGVLRVFPGNVAPEFLLQNGIRDAIGPVVKLVQDGEVVATDDGIGSVQAIAYRACDKMTFFFSCGCVKAPGMSAVQVANVLKSLNVTTAVMTSIEQPSSKSNTHAGMLYMGRNTSPTVGFKVPSGVAFWYVAKPMCKNGFEEEISSIVQNMGANQNAIENLMGGMDGLDLSNMVETVEKHTEQLKDIAGSIDTLTNDLEQVRANITSIEGRIDGLETAIATERQEREAADEDIRQDLASEAHDRETVDEQLQNAIEEEANQRQASDQNLQTDINNLKNGTSLPTATRTRKGVIKVGDNLTIAADGTLSAEPGVDIQAGTGITVTKTGKINTISVSSDVPSSDDIARLEELAQDAVDKATVADQAAKDAQDDVTALTEKVTANEQAIAAVESGKVDRAGDTMTGQLIGTLFEATEAISTPVIVSPTHTLNFRSINNLSRAADDATIFNPVLLHNIDSPAEDIDAANKAYVDIQTQAITDSITDGSALPIATTEKPGIVRVGANLSISPDGTLSASPSGEAAGNDVAAGDGISVSVDETSNVATVSLNQASKDAIAAVAGKAEKAAVTALESTVNAHKEIIDANTQNIDAVNTTVGTVSADVAQLKTDIASVDDTATEAMRTATDAEQKAVAAQSDATQAKTDAASALTEAGQALDEVAGKVSRAGDTMSGTLRTPGVTLTTGGNDVALTADNQENPNLIVGSAGTADITGAYFTAREGGKLKIIGLPTGSTLDGILPVYVGTPVSTNHAVPLTYLQNNYLKLTGGTLTGTLSAPSLKIGYLCGLRKFKSDNNDALSISGGSFLNNPVIRLNQSGKIGLLEFVDSSMPVSGTPILLRNVKTPEHANDAANKAYVDSKIVSTSNFMPKTGGTFSGVAYGVKSSSDNALTTNAQVIDFFENLKPVGQREIYTYVENGLISIPTSNKAKFIVVYLADLDGRSGGTTVERVYPQKILGTNRTGSSNKLNWPEFGAGTERPSIFISSVTTSTLNVHISQYSAQQNYHQRFVVVAYA